MHFLTKSADPTEAHLLVIVIGIRALWTIGQGEYLSRMVPQGKALFLWPGLAAFCTGWWHPCGRDADIPWPSEMYWCDPEKIIMIPFLIGNEIVSFVTHASIEGEMIIEMFMYKWIDKRIKYFEENLIGITLTQMCKEFHRFSWSICAHAHTHTHSTKLCNIVCWTQQEVYNLPY